MNSLFITGTGTDVGKTIVTGLLARFLLEKGYRVITQKWIQTETKVVIQLLKVPRRHCDPELYARGKQSQKRDCFVAVAPRNDKLLRVNRFSNDIKLHFKIAGIKKSDVSPYLSDIVPYTFNFPCSPHLSSYLEKKPISSDKIKKSFRNLSAIFDLVIVEGIGGALVPFNTKNLVIDIAKELKLPFIIVVDNKLGAINHTLLTIEALRKRKISIIGLIFNNTSQKENKIILKDNPKIIRVLSKERILGVLPYATNSEFLYKAFRPIGSKILQKSYHGDTEERRHRESQK